MKPNGKLRVLDRVITPSNRRLWLQGGMARLISTPVPQSIIEGSPALKRGSEFTI